MSTRAEFFQSMYPGLSDGEVILESGFHSVDVHVVAAGKHFLRAIIVKILISFHLNGSFNDLIVDFLTK